MILPTSAWNEYRNALLRLIGESGCVREHLIDRAFRMFDTALLELEREGVIIVEPAESRETHLDIFRLNKAPVPDLPNHSIHNMSPP